MTADIEERLTDIFVADVLILGQILNLKKKEENGTTSSGDGTDEAIRLIRQKREGILRRLQRP